MSAAMQVKGHFVADDFSPMNLPFAMSIDVATSFVSSTHCGIFVIPTVVYRGREWPYGWQLPNSRAYRAIKPMQSTRRESRNRDGQHLRPSPLGRFPAFDANYRADRDPEPKSVSSIRSDRKKKNWHNLRGQRKGTPLAAGGLSLAASFFTTLYLIEPHLATTPAVAALMQARVSSADSLMTAIKAARLKGSTNVKGTIDEVKRLDDRQVVISGWAAEIGNSATPLTVLAFVDGKVALAMRTSGRHPDVVSVLGASDAPEAANISFQGAAPCAHGQKLIIIAVTDGNSYGYFGTRDCP